MPETPEELYARTAGKLSMPPVHEWETFPFAGVLRPRELLPPLAVERSRAGAAGVDCRRCARTDDDYLWTNEHWRLSSLPKPSGLPVVVLLETRAHHDPLDLPPERARELGPLMLRVERAVLSVGEIGRVHICRWGDGSEHPHWWFMARPARMPQLVGSFAAIWDDVLPPTPEPIWRENLATVARALGADDG